MFPRSSKIKFRYQVSQHLSPTDSYVTCILQLSTLLYMDVQSDICTYAQSYDNQNFLD